MLRMIAAAGLVLALAASTSLANAETITFGTYDDGLSPVEGIGPTYSEGGFTFKTDAEFERWHDGNVYDSDHTFSTGLIINAVSPTVILTKDDGGSFDLVSLDVGDYYGSGAFSGPLNYSYKLGSGGSGSGSISVDNVPGYQTWLANLAGLASFTFKPSTGLYIQFDNFVVANSSVVTTTPLPAALPLFASALGGMGFVGWRRRRSESAAA